MVVACQRRFELQLVFLQGNNNGSRGLGWSATPSLVDQLEGEESVERDQRQKRILCGVRYLGFPASFMLLRG